MRLIERWHCAGDTLSEPIGRCDTVRGTDSNPFAVDLLLEWGCVVDLARDLAHQHGSTHRFRGRVR